MSRATLSPWAGQAKYVDTGYLDAGDWALWHLGPRGWFELDVELSPAAALLVAFDLSGAPPQGPWNLRRTRTGSAMPITDFHDPTTTSDDDARLETVVVAPPALDSSRLNALVRLGLLLAHPGGAWVVGPWVGVGLDRLALRFPDDPSSVWCAPERVCTGGDADLRKVYSTRRTEVLGVLGVEARIRPVTTR